MSYLAYAYETGATGKPDRELAEIWYKRGYEAGSLSALMQLSYLYLMTGRFDLAEEILQSGAEKRYSLATYVLGRHYVFGPEKHRNSAEGLKLLRRAADIGNIYAKRDLGHILMGGERGWLERAAGFYMYIGGFISIFFISLRKPNDPRLDMYGIY